MSHFAVIVIGENAEEQLAPYREHSEMPRYVKYTKAQLIEKERKEIEDYKNGTYAEYLADKEKYSENANAAHVNYLENEFPNKLNWSDEEVYADATKYYEPEEIGENGEVYSTYNPKSKWDWYVLGGRYLGRLILKNPNAPHLKGRSGTGGNEPHHKGGVDSASKKDIDFEKICIENKALAEKWWSEAQSIDATRRYFEYGIEDDETKEHYIQTNSQLSAYAFVKDGIWYERGKMGWFGIGHNEKGENVWGSEIAEMLKSLPDDALISIYDCHI